MKKYILSALYLILFSFLIFYAIFKKESLFYGIIFGIEYSFYTLIPSLFPMIFLSCAINTSSAKLIISKFFSLPCRILFKLPENCATIIIFGMCFGYPVGAKLCSIALEKQEITKEQANRLLSFCINAGFPFCVIFLGNTIFHNSQIGIGIFISNCLASIIIGFLFSLSSKFHQSTPKIDENTSFINILTKSSNQSLSATVCMCLYITIFSCFSSIISDLAITINFFKIENFSCVLHFIFEVTRGILHSSTMNASLEIFILGISFGGLCIHLQIFSLFPKSTINYLKFYSARILYSIVSLYLFKILIHFKPIEIDVVAYSSTVTNSSTITASLSLILLVIAFLAKFTNISKIKM